MTKPWTLKELSDLKNSSFGRPFPRHGLKLLYWFADDFLFLDNNNSRMFCRYNPGSAFYGFHRFRNREDRNGVKLLPDANLAYYAVGNLTSEGSDQLPAYVRQDYNGHICSSNMDRIIVSVDDRNIETVYVTEHRDRRDFNRNATFVISKELLVSIKGMSFEEFLFKSGYSRSGPDGRQKPLVWTTPADHGERAWFSGPAPDGQGQSNWYSHPATEEEVRGSEEIQISGFDELDDSWSDEEETERCRCVIL